jgi:hypothetical protein
MNDSHDIRPSDEKSVGGEYPVKEGMARDEGTEKREERWEKRVEGQTTAEE